MRILLIGATGTIGKAVAGALSKDNEVIGVSSKSTPITVDITSVESIKALYAKVGKVDAIVCAAGTGAFKPLAKLTDEDFAFSLRNKLMGQVNVVRFGIDNVKDGGSITLTSGVLSQKPMPGSSAVSLVNAGVEGFTRAAAIEAPRGIRVNVVSPPWVRETLVMLKMDPSIGLPASTVAEAYVRSVTGKESGATIEPV